MFDRSLGDTVTLDGYHGFLVGGRPLHSGPCTDDVYGCRRCNSALSGLTDEERDTITDLAGLKPAKDDLDHLFTFTCDWCSRKRERLAKRGFDASALPESRHDIGERCYHSCADEGGSVMYELCDACDSGCGCREYDDDDDVLEYESSQREEDEEDEMDIESLDDCDDSEDVS